ncbi:hypothetical protein AB0A74_11755 [Saccharothrix sp. NPDC042600]|uniref:hypothetical protein n=1 Tax=Saccharothrix TaxID=2071 RepID=UPI0033D7576A|nr:hypothetical protein GCM10017745_71600 [Saccharothrix mutabilis subsp. capreolus]
MTVALDPGRALAKRVEAGRTARYDAAGATIPAEVLRDVLLRTTGGPRMLFLRNAEVTGELDLEAGTVRFPVTFDHCVFTAVPNVEQARVSALYLTGCRLPGLRGSQLAVDTNLMLTDCTVSGKVSLTAAAVKGHFRVVGTRLVNREGVALNADGMAVDQNVKFAGGFVAAGRVSMVGARIGGQFDCSGATFDNPGRTALELSGLRVREQTFWCDDFRVRGTVSLRRAQLAGGLDCSGAVLSTGEGDALRAERLVVGSDVRFSGAVVEGRVDLTGCDVGGTLDLTGGRFVDPGRTALDLARAQVRQNLLCRSGFVAEGKVLLAGAEISGNLWCEGGRFDNSTAAALDAPGLIVHRDVRLADQPSASGTGRECFHAVGAVVLSGATVDGSLDCAGGRFGNAGAVSLLAVGMKVKRDMVLAEGFVADGTVDLGGTEVGGSLDCRGGRFTARDEALVADRVQIGHSGEFDRIHAEGPVRMRGMTVTGNLSFADSVITAGGRSLTIKGTEIRGRLRLGFASRINSVDLRYVTVAQLDDRNTVWPVEVRLEEFDYKALYEDPNLPERLACLRRNHLFAPQVYLQLARVYESAGKYDFAKRVLIAGEDARWRSTAGVRRVRDRVIGFLLKCTVGYGYRPLRVLYWIAALLLVGTAVFAWLGEAGFRQVKVDGELVFHPLLYTLDLLLPVVSLKQRDFWIAEGWALTFSTVFTVLGWVLAICLVTGLGKAFKREL